MVPKGWVKAKLGQYVRISSGIAPSSLSLSGIGKYPYVKVEDMNNCTKYQFISRTYSDDEIQFIPKGSVIFPKRGAAIMNNKVRIAATDLYLDSNMMSLFPVDGLDGEFLYYSLIREELHKIADTSTIPQINNKHIIPYRIVLPPLLEQKKIAEILSAWDKAITTTEQLLANSQQQKKALMQQLLTGKRRLLDKNGVEFSGDWEASKLSKLFDRVTTKNNGQSNNVVTISGQHGLIRQEDFFKKTVASETLDGYFLLKQGQFAYNKSYSNGYPMGAIKRLNRYADGVVTTLYICFEISDETKADIDYWEHYFESGLLNQGLSQIAHEGGRAHGLLNVKPSDFLSLKVPVPILEEQKKIATVLSSAEQEIIALQKKLGALRREKKALMQQLLTGKRRVLVS